MAVLLCPWARGAHGGAYVRVRERGVLGEEGKKIGKGEIGQHYGWAVGRAEEGGRKMGWTAGFRPN